MSPTSPSATTSGNEETTKRNLACVNCRNSKVRCRGGQVPGQPCQRCGKLGISCIFDRSHKRVTKRSKLEQLEQELRSIKEVVRPAIDGAPTAWTPPSPRAAIPALPNSHVPSPLPAPSSSSAVSRRSTRSSDRRLKTTPTEARILGGLVVSGEDIDWYFTKYLSHFHRFIPVLRKKDPDECYKANETLFWLVVYVASRRYARQPSLLSLLSEHLEKDVWRMASGAALDLEAIHALLIICTWPMPNVRFVTDPSPTLANIALTTALGLGCHTGRGNNVQFLVGMRQHFHATDEEASSTWLACCMLAQRMSAALGIPPPSIQHSDVKAKAALESSPSSSSSSSSSSSAWTDLLIMYDAQRFLNRFDSAMSAHITAHDGVHESEVSMWEADFESLKPLIGRHESSELSQFLLLSAQLHVQSAYFMSPPDTPVSPSLKANAVRVFNTARSIIALARHLESRCQLLTHAPQWAMRTIIDAASVVVSILHSDCSPVASEPDANNVVQEACAVILRTSVRDADLANRAHVIMETFWAIHADLPSLGVCPGSKPQRLAAGVTFWCLNQFRNALRNVQHQTDRVSKALEVMHGRGAATSSQTQPNQDQDQQQQQQQLVSVSDPIPEVDWSMFVDDYGWVGDNAVLLGLP